jgi:pyruvate formate lyase activating enzyme
VYTGNVHDEDGQSTLCPSCGEVVIGRDWYVLTRWRLDAHGRCTACGTQLPGVFRGRPGSWGPRRRPLRIAEQTPTAKLGTPYLIRK